MSQSLDPVDAAFYLFRRARGRATGFVVLVLGWLVLATAVSAAALWLAIPAFTELFAAMPEMRTMAEEELGRRLIAFYGELGPSAAVVVVWMWLGRAVTDAAALRYALSDGPEPFPYRLGSAELRIALVRLVLLIIHLLMWVVAIAACFALVYGLREAMGPMGGALGAVAASLVFMGFLVFGAWLSLRWAPAGALALRDGGLGLGAAWAASRGKSGGLFLAMLIVFAIALVVNFIIGQAGQIPLMGPMAEVNIALERAIDPGSDADAAFAQVFAILTEAFSRPVVWISLVASSVAQFVVQAGSRALTMGATALAIAEPAPADDAV